MGVPEAELVQVPLQVSRAHEGVRAKYRLLQVAPVALDPVGVAVAVRPLVAGVDDPPVPVALLVERPVAPVLVAVDHGARGHGGLYLTEQGLAVALLDHRHPSPAPALYHPEDAGLVVGVPAALASADAPADEALVDLHYPLHYLAVVPHQLPHLVPNPPRGLVGDAQSALQLLAADAVF